MDNLDTELGNGMQKLQVAVNTFKLWAPVTHLCDRKQALHRSHTEAYGSGLSLGQ